MHRTSVLAGSLACICSLVSVRISNAVPFMKDFSMGGSPMEWTVGNTPRPDYMPLNFKEEYSSPMAKDPVKALRLNPLAIMPKIDMPDISLFRQRIFEIGGIEKVSRWVRRPIVSEDRAFAFGNSGDLSTKFQLGMASNFLKPRIPTVTTDDILTAKMGLDYSLHRFHNLTAGLTLNNDALPFHANLSVGAQLGPVIAEMSARHFIQDQMTSVGTDLKYAVGSIAFHAGYHMQHGAGKDINIAALSAQDKAIQGFSGGFGVQKGSTELNYAIAQMPSEPSPSQNITLTLRWDSPKSSSKK